MSNIDKQIANALDRFHRESTNMPEPCRWAQSRGIWHCPHTAITAEDLIQRLPPEGDYGWRDAKSRIDSALDQVEEHKL